MKRVLIIGCGFAGLFAVRKLFREHSLLKVTVIDKKNTFDFLPLLPDIIGRGLNPDYLCYSLPDLGNQLGFDFVNADVKHIDLQKREILTDKGAYRFDYLLISSGAETDFFGNETIRQTVYKLYRVKDAVILKQALLEKSFATCLVSGGGSTGVETTAAISRFLHERNRKQKVVLVEKAGRIVDSSPEWLSIYAASNLEKMGVQIITNAFVEDITRDSVVLSNRAEFSHPLLVWTAGVKTAGFTADIEVEKNPQGRLAVDKFLRITDTCFAAGDVAMISHGDDTPLRMAAQFAISEAVCAAENIVRSIQGRPLVEYKLFDRGYIIPMANNHSCGIVLGVKVTGHLATLFHFFMSIYRSCGPKNKLGLFRQLSKEVVL